MRVFVKDRITYQLSSRKITDEGYLSAPAHVARSGIQQYLAGELGLPNRKPTEVINVYRPAEEVFNTDSLNTYQHKELTNNHPSEMVSAENYRDYSVGQVISPGTQSGEYVQVDLLLKDFKAIELVQSGKAELSAGYYADYVQEDGITDDEQKYEFVQRNIVINHVALVDKGRAGHGAKIFDQSGDKPMVRVTLDGNRSVELDDSVAPLVEDAIKRNQDKIVSLEKDLVSKDEEVKTAEAKADDKEEKLKEEKGKTSDAAIQVLVNDRLAVIDAARKLVKDIDCADKSIADIKREVVATLHPNRNFKDQGDVYINATFDMDKEDMEENDDDDEKKKKKAEDAAKKLGKDLSNVNTGDAQAMRDKVHQDFLDRRYGKKGGDQ